MSEERSPAPHSAAYFNDQRDFWWNLDFLRLLGRRLDLTSCRRALDVGAGVGHWGRLLLPMLANNATLNGVDPEPQWVDQARRAAEQAGIGSRCEYGTGAAEGLPFADATFDLVTCQTVLIHVADVAAALTEMVRVLAPGGLLLAAEPNNLAGILVQDSITSTDSIVDVLERVEFMLIYERGKQALGEGTTQSVTCCPRCSAARGSRALRRFLTTRHLRYRPRTPQPTSRRFAAPSSTTPTLTNGSRPRARKDGALWPAAVMSATSPQPGNAASRKPSEKPTRSAAIATAPLAAASSTSSPAVDPSAEPISALRRRQGSQGRHCRSGSRRSRRRSPSGVFRAELGSGHAWKGAVSIGLPASGGGDRVPGITTRPDAPSVDRPLQ